MRIYLMKEGMDRISEAMAALGKFGNFIEDLRSLGLRRLISGGTLLVLVVVMGIMLCCDGTMTYYHHPRSRNKKKSRTVTTLLGSNLSERTGQEMGSDEKSETLSEGYLGTIPPVVFAGKEKAYFSDNRWMFLRDGEMKIIDNYRVLEVLDHYSKEKMLRPKVAFNIEAWTLRELDSVRKNTRELVRKLKLLQVGDQVWFEAIGKTTDEIDTLRGTKPPSLKIRNRRENSGNGTRNFFSHPREKKDDYDPFGVPPDVPDEKPPRAIL